MKTFLARCIFFFLLFSAAISNAQPVITGSDTVCAGYMYSYTVSIPGAVTYTWTLPIGWYFLYGQGTDSVFVNCNANVDTITVVGLDSAGVPVDSAFKPVHWSAGGMGWHIQGNQTYMPPCYCNSNWTFSLVMDPPGCPGGCGSGVQNPNVYYAIFGYPWPTYYYVGPVGPNTSVPGSGWTYYVYLIDTTFGLANRILVTGGGGCGNAINSFYVPQDPPCTQWVWLTQSPDPVCIGDTFTVTANAWNLSTYYWSTFSPYITFIGPTNGPTVTAVLIGAPGGGIDFYASDWTGCYMYYGQLYVNYTYCGPPTAAFSTSPTTVCAGSCRTFYNNSQYATTYQWSFPGGTPSTSTNTNPYVCYSTPGQYSVTLTAFNSYGSSVLTQTNYITVNPSPAVTATGPSSPICSGQPALLAASGASTYTWSPSFSLVPSTGPAVTATPSSTTTYTVTGSQSGCTATAQVVVTVNPPPAMTLTPSQAICVGNSATLNATGATSYAWSPSATLSASTGSSVTATPASTTTYFVTGTSAAGCTATLQTIVTVNPLPVVSLSTDDTVCTGQSTVLSASGASSYTWSPSASLSSSTGSTVTATPSSNTTYTVTGSSNGCSSTAQVNVTVSPPPTVSVTLPNNICSGQSMYLYANGASTYTWSPASTLSASTGSSVNAYPLNTTTYTVTGNVGGCTATATTTIIVNPSPLMTVSPTQTICAGQSVTLNANGASSYYWSPSSSLSGSGPTVVATPSSTTTYTVTGTSTWGCTASSTITVIVNPLPAVSVSTNSSVCTGQSAVLIASGANSYTWSPSTSLSSSTGSSVTATPSATTTYTVTGSSNGCSATAQSTLTVNPSPSISVTPGDTICSGQSIALAAGGANTYAWSPAATLNTSTGPNVIANPPSTTTYTVTATAGNGCTASSQVTVTVNPAPPLSVSSSLAICYGQMVSLMANGASTYVWSPSSTLSSSTGSSVTATPVSTTTYTITGTDNLGCTASSQVTVTVNPIPVLTVTPDDTVCTGQSIQLSATGASTYTWSPSSTLSASTGSSVTANPVSVTTYTVVGNLSGCTASSQVTIAVSPYPVLAVSPDDSICSGQNTLLTASGAGNYIWSPSSSLSSSTGSSVTANPASTTTYTVTGNSFGCSSTAQVTVTVNASPALSVSPSTSVCNGQTATLIASGGNSYAWSPSSSLNTSAGPSVIANPSSTTTYTVTAANNNGCTTSSQITVTVFPIPVLSASPSVTICKDDSAMLTVSGANTYAWSPLIGLSSTTGSSVIATPDSTTIYTITATDLNGCTATASITVNVLPSPTVNALNNSPVCVGSSVTLTATGANTYTWQPGNMTGASVIVIPSSTTTYTVTGTGANGCSADAITTVTVNPLPAVILDLSAVDTQCVSINSVLLAGGNPAGGTYSGTAVTGNYFDPQAAGIGTHQITYTYTDFNGCINTATSVIYVDICTGISNANIKSGLEIYPNPTSGELNISLVSAGAENISLRIFDVSGRVILEKFLKITGPEFHSVIDLENEAEGLYYLQLTFGSEIITRKIIIER